MGEEMNGTKVERELSRHLRERERVQFAGYRHDDYEDTTILRAQRIRKFSPKNVFASSEKWQ